ncbi:hypothetical protein ACFKHW_38990 (plasmid) [Bradyrhizobium lupini]|uniref:hypothetical protein n=1 Tax=Rhizobium lupini TaxID=136996 RepID=UPI0036702C2B
MLVEGHGVEGDAHAGALVKHRYLARRQPRLPNLRQVHLIPAELFASLSDAGFQVAAGDLGENITTAGLDLGALRLACSKACRIATEAGLKVRLSGRLRGWDGASPVWSLLVRKR